MADPLAFEVLDAAVELLGRTAGGATLAIQGRSMLPTLRGGQRVHVEFRTDGLRRGDLLLFRQDGYLVLHRLVGWRSAETGSTLRTRGDGVLSLDSPVDPQSVLGRGVAFETDSGWRSLEGARARAYGRCVALHCLAWDAAGRVGGGVDRALGRLGVPSLARSIVWIGDRAALRVAHALLGRWAHPRTKDPLAPAA